MKNILAILLVLFTSTSFAQTYIQGKNLIESVASTATAAGTTTLTVSSDTNQVFTGATTQSVVLPDATTLQNGRRFFISNESSGTVTVKYNDASTIVTLIAGQQVQLRLKSNATSNGTWDSAKSGQVNGASEITGIIPNANTTATSANTASAIVARDGSGDFAGGRFTGNVTGALTGTASLASALAANGTNCNAGEYGRGVDASGNEENCAVITSLGTISTGVWNGTKVSEVYGGTNQNSYTAGDLLYASGSNTLSKLGIGSAGQVLKVTSSLPAWSAPPSGGIDYAAPNGDAELNATTGWANFADAAAASPVDLTGGSPVTAIATSSSSPLRGTYSYTFAKSANNRQGEGASFAFTIDAADKGQIISVDFDYLISSGTYVDNDMGIWIYDVTNSALIQPAPYNILNASVSQHQTVKFQAATNSVSYRVGLYVQSTSASAYTVQFDNFKIQPQSKVFGAAVTDWGAHATWTPTGSWVSNATYTGRYRQIGDEIEYEVKIALTGAPTTASLTITLPHTIDTAKLSSMSSATGKILGEGRIYDNGTELYKVDVMYNSSTSVAVLVNNASGTYSTNSGAVTQAVPMTFANTDEIVVTFRAPIVGKSSSMLVSSDADTRVVSMRAYKSSGAQGTSGSYIVVPSWDTVAHDTHGAFNTTSGVYTVKVPGKYKVFAQVAPTANGTGIRATAIAKNGTRVLTGNVLANASYPLTSSTGGTIDCIAGDTLSVYYYQDSGGSLNYYSSDVFLTAFSVDLDSGPAQIAASESVSVRATNAAGSSISSEAAVPFATEEYDSHNAWATDTFTAPMSGVYHVSSTITFVATTGYTVSEYAHLAIYANAVEKTRMSWSASTTLQQYTSLHASADVRLLAGQTVQIKARNDHTVALNNAAGINAVSIHRVGNY